MMMKKEESFQTQLISNWPKGLIFLLFVVELFVVNDVNTLIYSCEQNIFLSFVVFLPQALSNVYSVRATVTDKDPLTWNFNPKVLSPIFTLLTLNFEILVIRLRYPSFLASILSYKAAAD